MSNKDLIIINNEKISKEDFYCCDNVDMQSIPEDLNNYFDVTVIARNSKIKRKRKINLQNIKIAKNIFSFLYFILKTFKKDNAIYLLISITPYTFLSYILLFILRKNVFIYLRSNGYEEYKAIFGIVGPAIYYFMFTIATARSKVITCQERLFPPKKSNIVFPSELSSLWLEDLKKPLLNKIKILYVGRLKIEKGIFSLLEILKDIKIDFDLSIVGKKENFKHDNKKVNFIGYGYAAPDLIKIYDSHNIFILPSFTEAHPKVIDESLARKRPVIIFEDIKHIVQNKKGIFVSKRNVASLEETINFIINNYEDIQKSMTKNIHPTKKDFILKLSNILSSS